MNFLSEQLSGAANELLRVAGDLLRALSGKTAFDFGARAYLRNVVAGRPAHFLFDLDDDRGRGAEAAHRLLVDLGGMSLSQQSQALRNADRLLRQFAESRKRSDGMFKNILEDLRHELSEVFRVSSAPSSKHRKLANDAKKALQRSTVGALNLMDPTSRTISIWDLGERHDGWRWFADDGSVGWVTNMSTSSSQEIELGLAFDFENHGWETFAFGHPALRTTMIRVHDDVRDAAKELADQLKKANITDIVSESMFSRRPPAKHRKLANEAKRALQRTTIGTLRDPNASLMSIWELGEIQPGWRWFESDQEVGWTSGVETVDFIAVEFGLAFDFEDDGWQAFAPDLRFSSPLRVHDDPRDAAEELADVLRKVDISALSESLHEADQVGGTAATRGTFGPDVRRLDDPEIKASRLGQIVPEMAALSKKWGIRFESLMQIGDAYLTSGTMPSDIEDRFDLEIEQGRIVRKFFGELLGGYAVP